MRPEIQDLGHSKKTRHHERPGSVCRLVGGGPPHVPARGGSLCRHEHQSHGAVVSRVVATGDRRWQGQLSGSRSDGPKPLHRADTVCSQANMVRRGSTVRVRQRALQNPRSRGFFVRTTCCSSHVRWVWSRLWSFRVDDPLLAGPDSTDIPRPPASYPLPGGSFRSAESLIGETSP
jgi:hypothetical protein